MIVRSTDRVLVQGITGRQGTFWTERMQECGTRIVAGVSPSKGGTSALRRARVRQRRRGDAPRGVRRGGAVRPARGRARGGDGGLRGGRAAARRADRAHPGLGRGTDARYRTADGDADRRAEHRRAGDAGRGVRRHHAGVQRARVPARRCRRHLAQRQPRDSRLSRPGACGVRAIRVHRHRRRSDARHDDARRAGRRWTGTRAPAPW